VNGRLPEGHIEELEDAQLRPTTKLLKTVPLLSDLDESELEQIAAFFTMITLRAGQTLYAEGSAANSACFVIDGELDAFTKLPGGGEAMVGTIMPGAIIGEMALLDGGRRTASVRARTNAKTLEVSAAFFQASLGQMDLPTHKILRRVVCGLADRLSVVRAKIVNQMEQRVLDGVYIPAVATPPVPTERQASEPFDFRRFMPLLPFFRRFLASEIDRILSFGQIIERPKRTDLYEEGGQASSAYLIIRGCVDCSVWRNGRMQLSVIGPGRICGANEMISGRDRQNSAGTRTNALLLEINNAAFNQLFTGSTAECLKFQNAIGLTQLNDLKSANNLLALLVNLAQIRAGPQLVSVS
jgi:CRP-like cAMP-binding protein